MKTTHEKPAHSSVQRTPKHGAHMDNELHRLFLNEIADLLNSEMQLTHALPKMIKAAQSDELAEAFRSHLAETEHHVERLEQVFALLDEEVKTRTCKAMKGLVEEGSDLIDTLRGKNSIDAGLIAAGQKVEHYEIASYGTVHAWAEQMGHIEAAGLLEATLAEEKAANDKLTEIALSGANASAE